MRVITAHGGRGRRNCSSTGRSHGERKEIQRLIKAREPPSLAAGIVRLKRVLHWEIDGTGLAAPVDAPGRNQSQGRVVDSAPLPP